MWMGAFRTRDLVRELVLIVWRDTARARRVVVILAAGAALGWLARGAW